MSRNNDEEYLNFLRYQEVTPDNAVRKSDRTVTRKDEKWLRSTAAKREVKRQAKEDRKHGRN